MLIDDIKRLAEEIHTTVIANRRHLHAHPELSFCEHNTSAFIKQKLTEAGIQWKPIADTGIVAVISGEKKSDRVVALRADMDALPILEENAIDYRSRHKGVMHACGHDVHTSSLLGTAEILQRLKSRFGGEVKFLFQPGEEKIAGGASLMIQEGVLENPKPDVVIGQHVMPSLPTGKIGIRKGKFMASMDEIRVNVYGKGGHAAQPHLNIDPVLITSHIIIALQQVVSRMANPALPTVLSFGKLEAKGGINIIPNEVYIEGTFRTFDERWRMDAHARMKKIAESMAESMGGSCNFQILKGYPYLVNNEKLSEQISNSAMMYLGKESVVEMDLWMAAEDFAYYSQVIDCCFFMLGTGNEEKNTTASLHSPTFNIDEDALAKSTGLMAYLAMEQLGFS